MIALLALLSCGDDSTELDTAEWILTVGDDVVDGCELGGLAFDGPWTMTPRPSGGFTLSSSLMPDMRCEQDGAKFACWPTLVVAPSIATYTLTASGDVLANGVRGTLVEQGVCSSGLATCSGAETPLPCTTEASFEAGVPTPERLGPCPDDLEAGVAEPGVFTYLHLSNPRKRDLRLVWGGGGSADILEIEGTFDFLIPRGVWVQVTNDDGTGCKGGFQATKQDQWVTL